MNSSNTTGYGLQSSTAKGLVDTDAPIIGAVPFSGTNYWDNSVCQYTGTTWGCTGTSGLKSEYATNGSYSGSPYPNVYNSSLSSTSPSIDNLYSLLESAIKEDAPLTIKEGGIFKEGYSKEIDELRSIKSGGKDFISNFEIEEKERTGLKGLKVGYNKVFGYYIEIPKGQIKDVKEEFQYERRQTLSNCERYITPLLKEKEKL